MSRSLQRKKDCIEKPEDKEWLQWYNGLTPQDHEKYLAKLGLDKEDKEELEEIKKELKKAKTDLEEEREA